MTVSELYKQVAGLGFESSLEDESRFYFAAERALLQVARIRPATRTYTIYHAPLKNAAQICTFAPVERSEDLCFEAMGAKAYYFESNGEGIVYPEWLDDGHWKMTDDYVRISSADHSFKPYSGFIKVENKFVDGPVRLRFTGMYLYAVRCVALYAHTLSDLKEDIPAYAPFSKYDISELTSDFLGLASPPVTDDENREVLNQNYGIENDRTVLLPYDARGCYHVNYYHRPAVFSREDTAGNSSQKIDLDEDLCALLPTLIAAYIWAEDEPSLAEYYLSLYQQQAAEVLSRTRSLAPIKIQNNGW